MAVEPVGAEDTRSHGRKGPKILARKDPGPRRITCRWRQLETLIPTWANGSRARPTSLFSLSTAQTQFPQPEPFKTPPDRSFLPRHSKVLSAFPTVGGVRHTVARASPTGHQGGQCPASAERRGCGPGRRLSQSAQSRRAGCGSSARRSALSPRGGRWRSGSSLWSRRS